MAPGDGRPLHFTRRTNAGYSPTGKLFDDGLRLVRRSAQADAGDLPADFGGAVQSVGQSVDGFDVKEAVLAAFLEAGIGIEDHRLRGGSSA